jgi:hypothetical protein
MPDAGLHEEEDSMADLSSYQVAEFDQSEVLGSTYRNKRDVQGGVCSALSVAWVHAIESGAEIGDIDAVKRQFDLSVNSQRIIGDAYREMGGRGFQRFNAVSHITRLKLADVASGENVDPIKQTFANLSDGYFFLYVNFDAGAHMIALWKDGDDLTLFDPNFGVYIAEGDDEVEDMAEGLFDEYSGIGMAIGSWFVYSVDFAESALDRYKRASGAR